MSTRHRRTLEAVFRDPVSATLAWGDVERMLLHYGATIQESGGSRVGVKLRGVRVVFHRPHPQKEAPRRMIRKLREFLTRAGLVP